MGNFYMSKRIYDENGWFEIKANPLSKAGVFPYIGSSIYGAADPQKIYQIYRPEEELASEDTIKSCRLIPWIDEHPPALLGDSEVGMVPAERAGVHGTTGEDVFFKDGVLYTNLKIYSEAMGDLIDDGKKELSWGYRCRIDWTSGTFEGKKYDGIQRDMRGNHVALVKEGRMGKEVGVLDSADIKNIGEEMTEGEVEVLKARVEMMESVIKTILADAKKASVAMDVAEPEEKATPAADEDEKKKEEEEEAMDSEDAEKSEDEAEESATDESEEVNKKLAAMDAALKKMARQVSTVTSSFDSLDSKVAASVNNVRADEQKKASLVNKVSALVGTFDSASMSTNDVAKYTLKKMGMTTQAGNEAAFLDGYLKATEAKSSSYYSSAMDAAAVVGGISKLLDYSRSGNK